MSSIGSIGSAAGIWDSTQTARSMRPPGGMDPSRMFKKVDSDGSGGLDTRELQSMLDDMASHAPAGASTSSVSASDMLGQYDANQDGSLDQDELGQAMQALRPPTSTVAFAQRFGSGEGNAPSATSSATSASTSTSSTDGGDDLFSKLDTDGNGEVSSDELQVMLDKMAQDHGGTARSASDEISRMDTDGNGTLSASELQAGRQRAGGPGLHGGPPPGPPPAEATASSDAASSTDSLQSLLQAIDTDGNRQISSSELDTFAQVLQQMGMGGSWASGTASTPSTASSGSGSSTPDGDRANRDGMDFARFAQQVVQRYAALGTSQTTATSLSLAA